MAMMKYDPFRTMEKFFEDVPFFPVVPRTQLGFDLAVDLFEEKDRIIAEMNLPGVIPEKIEVTFQNGDLKVKGTREEEKETKEKEFYSKEIRRGEFERLVHLTTKIVTEKAEAIYHNGVLKIVMPKAEETKVGKLKVKVD